MSWVQPAGWPGVSLRGTVAGPHGLSLARPVPVSPQGECPSVWVSLFIRHRPVPTLGEPGILCPHNPGCREAREARSCGPGHGLCLQCVPGHKEAFGYQGLGMAPNSLHGIRSEKQTQSRPCSAEKSVCMRACPPVLVWGLLGMRIILSEGQQRL